MRGRGWTPSGRPRGLPVALAALLLASLVPLAGADEGAFVQTASLTASDAGVSDSFGTRVAISRDTAIVGAIFDDDNGADAGAAYIFVRSDGTWSQEAKLTASDGAAGDRFGVSVFVSGDTAIVGAFLDDDNGADSGSAYVFVRSGTTWTQQAKLTPADGAAGDSFGAPTILDADTALIGAFRDDGIGLDSGSAYVFVRTGASWSQQAKLTALDASGGDQFGSRAYVRGDDAIIGAPLDDPSGGNSGSAYVFTRSGVTWSQQTKLTAADGDDSDQFGSAAVLGQDTAIVGAENANGGSASSGAAYIFTRAGTTWTQQAKLTTPDGSTSDKFGARVGLSGDTAIVTAPFDDDRGTSSGSVYVYARDATGWTQRNKLTAADGTADDRFGAGAAIHGDTLLVGAPFHDSAGTDAGAVYVFDAPEEPLEDELQDDAGSGGDASDDPADPTPLPPGDTSDSFTGQMAPATDGIDAYGLEIPADATRRLCFSINPQPALDIRLHLLDPGLTEVAFADAAGLGATETVCFGTAAGPFIEAGEWVLVVELLDVPRAGGSDLGIDPGLGAFHYRGDRQCEPNC